MKALTLTQPWASAIALGYKTVETRSWQTSYRGEIAIHAAKGFPSYAKDFAAVERGCGRYPEGRIPLAAVVAVARLVRIEPTQDVETTVTALDRLYGDYSWGRFAWFFEDIRPLPEPIGCLGKLGLWDLPATVEAKFGGQP